MVLREGGGEWEAAGQAEAMVQIVMWKGGKERGCRTSLRVGFCVIRIF